MTPSCSTRRVVTTTWVWLRVHEAHATRYTMRDVNWRSRLGHTPFNNTSKKALKPNEKDLVGASRTSIWPVWRQVSANRECAAPLLECLPLRHHRGNHVATIQASNNVSAWITGVLEHVPLCFHLCYCVVFFRWADVQFLGVWCSLSSLLENYKIQGGICCRMDACNIKFKFPLVWLNKSHW